MAGEETQLQSSFASAPAALSPGKKPVPTVEEAGWTPEPVWA